MRRVERVSLQGRFIAELRDPRTGLVTTRRETPNLVTAAGHNLVARAMLGITGYSLGLTYQAVGTGSTAAAVTDTALEAEHHRRVFTSRSDTSRHIAAFYTFFPGSDIAIVINEVGVFGGPDALDAADSGLLFARAQLTLDNSSGDNLTMAYILTVS